jgi:hypothetical protein
MAKVKEFPKQPPEAEVEQAPVEERDVPTFSLRADEPAHLRMLIELYHAGRPELETVVREFELYQRG